LQKATKGMPEQTLRIAVSFLVFVFAAYGLGLRLSGRLPFLRLAPPARIFAWVVLAAARSRLRKMETHRDWFVYREGRTPGPADLAQIQIVFIAGLGIVLLFSSIAT
jgi:hypothetical protein